MGNKSRLLSVKTTAEMLGVHDDTVRRWGDDGTLEMVRTSGGHRRYPQRAVERMLSNNPQDAKTPQTELLSIAG